MMDKSDFKFMNRFVVAPLLACKNCIHCAKHQQLSYVCGNTPNSEGKFSNLTLDGKVKAVLALREDCRMFQTEEPVERDTTYPGSTFAPHDNNHDDLLPDSTDLYFNPKAPKRCINAEQKPIVIVRKNQWEKCLDILFDRKRGIMFPSITTVLELLNNSFIPQYTFRLGLPPQRGMGFDRGLWFYRSEKFNSQPTIPADEDIAAESDAKKKEALLKAKATGEHNVELKSQMKKLVMVYLYHVWFKKITEEKKLGVFLALDSSNPYSLGKDLSWWMLKVFKDEKALETYPDTEFDIELIPMSLLDKAQEAAMLAAAGVEDMEHLDLEVQEYEALIAKYGYKEASDGFSIKDKEGKEILY